MLSFFASMHVQDMSNYSEESDPPMLKQQLLTFTVLQQVYNIIQWNVRYPNMSGPNLVLSTLNIFRGSRIHETTTVCRLPHQF